jgi:hypothetical protein
MSDSYNIILGGIHIGTTALEHADPPMGIVFGKIRFRDSSFNFRYFKHYCTTAGIAFSGCDDDIFISTYHIPDLKVINSSNSAIKGLSTTIEGADSDGFNIYVIGIDATDYEFEFPAHVRAYKERFNEINK